MSSFVFKKTLSWAILPYVRASRGSVTDDNSSVYNSFRYLRQSRRKENCWPWRLYDQMGWDVCSPVDVVLEPLFDVEISALLEEEEILSIANSANLKELWRRGSSYIAFPSSNWLRLYDFDRDGKWVPMFTPNGQGTVEWNFGWSLSIPDDMAILTLGADNSIAGIDIPGGLILSKKAKDFVDFSIAINIKERTMIRRGDVIARLVPVSKSVLKVSSEFIDL
ncbi:MULTISPECIES: hypothetical protein [Pseudomonas]|uniref:hypothetical protein n=1 Tax=Pseudomonas TaxID=286 RepID=UPI001179D23E|nr:MULTISPECIES: hypothetical protein [Pseudomonas]